MNQYLKPMFAVFIVLETMTTVVTPSSLQLGMHNSGGTSQRYKITINADGTGVIELSNTSPRAAVEAQLRMMEVYKKMEKSGGKPVPPSKDDNQEVNPMTDDELKSKLNEMYANKPKALDDEDAEKVEQRVTNIEVSADKVTIGGQKQYKTIKDLIADVAPSVRGFGFGSVTFESVDGGKLRLRIQPMSAEYGMTTDRFGQMWKRAKNQAELRFVLPSKIESSGLTKFDGNETWFEIDGTKSESVDAAVKVIGSEVVIVSANGGLTIPEPLNGDELMRAKWREQQPVKRPELPIVDAGPGFVAEAQSVSTTTVVEFSGLKDLPKRYSSQLRSEPAGTRVSVKVYAPRGRFIRGQIQPKLVSAVDDQGQPIGKHPQARDENEMYGGYFNSWGADNEVTVMETELWLAEPAPNAAAIDELVFEVVATTSGPMKTKTVTNMKLEPNTKVDLGDVAPGAQLVVKEVKSEDEARTVSLEITGPKDVGLLEVKFSKAGEDSFGSGISRDKTETKGDVTTRRLTVAFHMDSDSEYGKPAANLMENMVLKVSLPTDMKRERVKLKLTALDLF